MSSLRLSFLRIPNIALIGIAAAGVALRLLAMWAIWSNGGSPLLGDEGNYVLSALPLSEGYGIPDLWLWIRAPGFIFFAAGVFALTGGSLWALNLAQVCLYIINTLLAYTLGNVAAGDSGHARRTGLWAAAFVACNPLIILSDNFFLSEPLYILFVLALALLLCVYTWLVSTGNAGWWVWWVGGGACAGWGMLTRPNLQFFMPLVALWLLYVHRPRILLALGRVALLAAASLVVVLPWSLHNLSRYGHFVLVDTVGSYVLYIDNTDLSFKEVNSDLQRFENQGERQEYAFAQGFEWIANHKAKFAARTLERMATSWAIDPFTDFRYPVRDKLPGTAPILRDMYALSATVAYLLLTVLALGGLLAAPRTDLKILALLYLAAYVITIGLSNNEFRYRLPVLALTSGFAGYALAAQGAFWPLRFEGRWRRGPVAACALSLLFVAVSLPLVWPGLTRAVEARMAEAAAPGLDGPAQRAEALEKVAALDRVYAAPWRDAGVARERVPGDTKALEDLKKAVQLEPGDWRSTIELALNFRRANQPRKAASVTNNIPPTFNKIMLDRAYSGCASGCALPEFVDVGGDDLGFVRGFYVGEESGSQPPFTFRWSESSASIRLSASSTARRVVVRAIGLPGPLGEPLSVRWTVRTADRQDTYERTMDAAWKDYAFDLPPGTARESAIEVALTAVARRPSTDDRRELAVAVDSVRTDSGESK